MYYLGTPSEQYTFISFNDAYIFYLKPNRPELHSTKYSNSPYIEPCRHQVSKYSQNKNCQPYLRTIGQ